MNESLYQAMAAWIDGVLTSEPAPEGVAAFCLNLYDGPNAYQAQLIGAPIFDPDDTDWACDDIYSSPDPHFRLPQETVGRHWEKGLAEAAAMLTRYIGADNPGARRIRRTQALAVGFVDGDLVIVWSATS